jgi:hypothetical protein
MCRAWLPLPPVLSLLGGSLRVSDLASLKCCARTSTLSAKKSRLSRMTLCRLPSPNWTHLPNRAIGTPEAHRALVVQRSHEFGSVVRRQRVGHRTGDHTIPTFWNQSSKPVRLQEPACEAKMPSRASGTSASNAAESLLIGRCLGDERLAVAQTKHPPQLNLRPICRRKRMARVGIEPTTPRFSVVCSTN